MAHLRNASVRGGGALCLQMFLGLKGMLGFTGSGLELKFRAWGAGQRLSVYHLGCC